MLESLEDKIIVLCACPSIIPPGVVSNTSSPLWMIVQDSFGFALWSPSSRHFTSFTVSHTIWEANQLIQTDNEIELCLTS